MPFRGRRRNWLKVFFLSLAFVLVLTIVACTPRQKFKYQSDPTVGTLLKKEAAVYPATKFIVISDLHLYDPSLGTEGDAFDQYLALDRKLLRESTEIMEAAMAAVEHEDATFVLVPGDLTKDGELVSHELVARYLTQVEAAGKKVYVIPGNHDINNGLAFKFSGDSIEPVPRITSEDFARIYSQFGYGEALYRDHCSLSYVVEPVPGLWLLALDACRSAENVTGKEPVTGGKFGAATLEWIEDMLAEAKQEDKAVIVMLHHSIMEQYRGQKKDFGEYIIDDYHKVSKLLAMYDVRVVFTGHYHAQDITLAKYAKERKAIYDIETGSLVTSPSPYRVVNIDANQEASIRSENIKFIRSHPSDFPEYATSYLREGIEGIATRTIMSYGVNHEESARLAKQVAMAFAAHYAGDEKLPAGQEVIQTSGLSLRGWLVVTFRKSLVYSLWTDLEPPDNNIVINLSTGDWRQAG